MKRPQKILPFLYLNIAVLALFMPLLGNHTLFFRDVQLLFMPMKHFLAASWDKGQIPFWNPMLFCGTPFLSDVQSGIFYPLSLVFYLVPMPYALNIFVITHYMIAACLLYALTRQWGCSVAAACLSGLCFTLGGYLVSMANVLNNLQAAIWLPAIFLAFEKSRQNHALFYCLLGAALLAIQFLGGEPQLLLFTIVLIFAYNLIVNRETSWLKHTAKTTTVLALVGIVSIGLASIQFLPSLELFVHSTRSAGLTFQDATKHSLNPLALFQLLGPPSFDIHDSGRRVFSWLLSNYFGLMPLVFALIAIVFVRGRRVRFWTGCLFVSLALALGKHTPLFFLLYKTIPFFKSFRFPEKFMFVFAYSIAFLAAFGFDWIIERDFRAAKRVMAIFAFLVASFLVALLIGTTSVQSVANHISIPTRSFLLVFVSLLCISLFFRKVLTKSTFAMLIILVSTVDLVLAHMPFNPVVPKEFYINEPKLVHTVESNIHSERILVQTASFPSSHLSPFAIQHLWRHYLWPNSGTLHNVYYVNGIGGTETNGQWFTTELLEKLNLKKRIRFLELTNTRYLVAMDTKEIESEMWAGRLKTIQTNVYELLHSLPRAYMVGEVKVVPSQAKAIEEILKDDFDPLQSVVLEKQPQTSVTDVQGGKVLEWSYEGHNKIKVTAQSHGGYLVLLDSFYPGWRAFVNDQEREVLRANGLFRSVFLEPGLHQIVFAYQPGSFLYGICVSFISLCLVAVGLWVWRPKQRDL